MLRAQRLPSLKTLTTLQWALGLSVLLHAALLTIRFVDPEGFKRVFQDTTLDVVLVNAESDEKPEKPQALAQATLAGGGEAADKRMVSTPLPPAPVESQGDSAVNENQRRIDSMLEQQEQLLAQVRQQLATMPKVDPQKLNQDPEAQAQEERRQQLQKLLAAIERRVEEENSRPRKRYLSPATLGTTYAVYYDALRHKVEEKGTENFPEVGGRKLYGDLIMVLTINHDGRVLETEIVESSGQQDLDRRAQAIAYASGPFGSFTPAMRAQADQIVVVARFSFTRDQVLQANVQANER